MDFEKMAKEYAATIGEKFSQESEEISAMSPTPGLDRKMLTKLAMETERKRKRFNFVRAAASIVVIFAAGVWALAGLNNQQDDYATEQLMPLSMPEAASAPAESWHDAATGMMDIEMDDMEHSADASMDMATWAESEAEVELELLMPTPVAPPLMPGLADDEYVFGLRRQSLLQMTAPEGWLLEHSGHTNIYRFTSDTGVQVQVVKQALRPQEYGFADIPDENDYDPIVIGEITALLHPNRHLLYVEYGEMLVTFMLDDGVNYSYMIELAEWLLPQMEVICKK